MFAPIFTVVVTALFAFAWALLSSLSGASSGRLPHDPTTVDLSVMAVVTIATYAWASRYRTWRREASVDSLADTDFSFADPANSADEDEAEHAA